MCHDSFVCMTWHTGAVWYDSFVCVTWLTLTRDMNHSYTWHDTQVQCDMTHSYVWHDSFICVTWLNLTCDITHSYAWNDWQVQRIPFHDHSAPALRYNYVTQIAKETYIQTFKETNKTGQLNRLFINNQTFKKRKIYFHNSILNRHSKRTCVERKVCVIYLFRI